jgi:hypothetical protein
MDFSQGQRLLLPGWQSRSTRDPRRSASWCLSLAGRKAKNQRFADRAIKPGNQGSDKVCDVGYQQLAFRSSPGRPDSMARKLSANR